MAALERDCTSQSHGAFRQSTDREMVDSDCHSCPGDRSDGFGWTAQQACATKESPSTPVHPNRAPPLRAGSPGNEYVI